MKCWTERSTSWNQDCWENISNLRYTDYTNLMAESKELKSFLMKVKQEHEKAGLKLNIQKMKIMASSPITSWQRWGNLGNGNRLYFLGLHITADGDCSHEIKGAYSPDGQYQNQIDYVLCSQRWRSSIQSAKTRLRADCGSDHELLIVKFRLKLKKIGKTIRPFRYDLNQIPYDYTVEVRNRLKALDLIDRVPDELWTEVCDIVQETGIKTIPKKKKCKKAKWLSEEALTIAMKKKRSEKQRRKGKIHLFECRIPKNSKER